MAPTEELPPLRREELPVCNMCRAGIHKKCVKVTTPQEFCVCDCERGY